MTETGRSGPVRFAMRTTAYRKSSCDFEDIAKADTHNRALNERSEFAF
jgi:hypothetical protein